MDPKKTIEDIIKFCQKAGRIALENQENITFDLKDNQTVVTQTDLAISALARDKFSAYMDQGHIIIDEESVSQLSENYYKNTLCRSQYTWVIDPIDGTHPYALSLPFWGLSIGVLKDNEPWIGALYLPLTQELLYYDRQNVSYITNVFSDKEKKHIISPVSLELNDKSVFFTPLWLNINYDLSTMVCLDCYAYVPKILWTLVNKSVGVVFGAYLWDMCGGWSIAKALGFEYFDITNDKTIDHFSFNLFSETWRVKNPWILCRSSHYQELREKILDFQKF